MVKTYVALLRGVNVGGKNLLPMRELAEIFGDAGAREVRTYIQSGNVVFRADENVAARLPQLAQKRIATRFGFESPILLRSQNELAKISRSNSLLEADTDIASLLVMFLANRPSPRSVAALDGNRSPPDQFVVRGREIFLRCPNGFGRSKLTNNYFDKQLATTSTGRNWRTVLKLLEMCGEASRL